MSRLATMLGLGSVAGFCGASALRLAAQAGLLDDVPAIVAAVTPFDLTVTEMPGNEAVAFSAVFAAVGIGALSAIAAIAGGGPQVPVNSSATLRRGETIAAATLTGLIAFYATAAMVGSPVAALFGAGPGFLFAMALCFAGLLFDRMVEVEDHDASDAAFEAALEAIREAEREALRANWHDGRSRDREVR